MKTKHRYTIDGVTYKSLDEMPPDVRVRWDRVAATVERLKSTPWSKSEETSSPAARVSPTPITTPRPPSVYQEISYVLGVLFTGVLILFAVLMPLTILSEVTRGYPHASTHETRVQEVISAVVALILLVYLNLLDTYRQLKKIDAAAYWNATRGVGAMTYFWARNGWGASSSIWLLHRSLVTLRRDLLPPRFARRVRITIALDRLFAIAVSAVVLMPLAHKLIR